jgi:hypothetical protein
MNPWLLCLSPHHNVILTLLALLLVVDLVVPEQRLVAVAPWERLVPDVKVVVLWAFFWWRAVLLVFPMFVPECVGVGAEDDQAGDDDAVSC